MKLKLKNIEREFSVSAPTERFVKGASKDHWLVTFSVQERLSTEEVESYFTAANTEEMVFSSPLPNGTEYEFVIKGYTDLAFSVIRNAEDGSGVVDLQFTKGSVASDSQI